MRQQQQQQRKTAAVFESLEGRALFNATISGLVHNDVNGDGILDEFSAAPATRVYLDQNGNGRRDGGEASVLTDVNGRYAFKDLPGGSYLVRFELPKGWAPSNATAAVGEPANFRGVAEQVSLPDAMIRYAAAPWATVGQNAQHTGISPFRGGTLTSGTATEVTTDSPTTVPDTGIKLGTPLFTKNNTAIETVYDTTTRTYEVRAFSRSFGVLLWTFVSDYVEPRSVQLSNRTATAVFQPTLGADGTLYVPGAGGTVWVIATPDRIGSGAGRTKGARRVVFYGKANFKAKPGRYRRTVQINTPLTAGPNGDVYFGVEGTGANPLAIESSLVRVRADGTGSRVRADVVTGSAPTLSNDGAYVYVATQTGKEARLERFGAGGGMAKAGSILLKDPKNHKKVQLTPGTVAVPVVAPDGDVYLATPARAPSVNANGDGWLMRFTGDLSQAKGTRAQVMPDATPSIVPASMVPSYHGGSTYLVTTVRFTKPGERQSQLDAQRLSLYDPAKSLKRTGGEFLLPAVQDSRNQLFYGFASSPVTVDPSSGAIYLVTSADQLQRWNVSKVRTITPPVSLDNQVDSSGGSPAVIGPDGVVYATVSGKLYAAF